MEEIATFTCKCCEDFYVGKTQRERKSRCQEYYQGTGKILKKKLKLIKELNEQLPPQTEDSIELSSGRTGVLANKAMSCLYHLEQQQVVYRNTHTPSVRHLAH